jgi:hypothetical protein
MMKTVRPTTSGNPTNRYISNRLVPDTSEAVALKSMCKKAAAQ